LLGGGQGVAVSTAAFPLPGFLTAEGTADNGDPAGYHESGIEANTELTDNVNVLVGVFLLEIQAAALGNGAQVALQLILGHADTVIADHEGTGFPVHGQKDSVILLGSGNRTVSQTAKIQLVDSIAGVADQLTKEDFFIGVDGID